MSFLATAHSPNHLLLLLHLPAPPTAVSSPHRVFGTPAGCGRSTLREHELASVPARRKCYTVEKSRHVSRKARHPLGTSTLLLAPGASSPPRSSHMQRPPPRPDPPPFVSPPHVHMHGRAHMHSGGLPRKLPQAVPGDTCPQSRAGHVSRRAGAGDQVSRRQCDRRYILETTA